MSELKEAVIDLLDRKGTQWNRDKEDVCNSRSVSSGFGMTEDDQKFRGKDRVSVTLNQVYPWVTTLGERLIAAPFGVSCKGSQICADAIDAYMSPEKIGPISRQMVEGTANDGYSFLLVYNSGEDVRLSILESDRVIFDDCDDPTGEDCDMACYVSSMLKSKATAKYGIETFRTSDDPFSAYVDDKGTKYISVSTVYRKTKTGVSVDLMVGGEVVEDRHVEIEGMRRLPIIRCVAKQIWLPSTRAWHYRGIYWMVYDLLRTANYQMSSHMERIATAPLAKMIGDYRLAIGHETELNQAHQRPTMFIGINGKDPQTGEAIPPPTLFPENRDNSDLLNGVQTVGALIADILGKPSPEPVRDEKEISALMRKETGDASANMIIRNIKDAFLQAAYVCCDFVFAQTKVPREDVKIQIEAGPQSATSKERKIMQLQALYNLIKQDPANPTLPMMIEEMDLSDAEKNMLMTVLQNGAQANQAATQQIGALQQQLAQAQQENQWLRESVLAEREKSTADVYINMQKIASAERIEAMKQSGMDERQLKNIIAESAAQENKARIEFEKAQSARIDNRVQLVPGARVSTTMGMPRV